MNEQEPKIHIDSDWKDEARKEKERLAQAESKTAAAPRHEEANFLGLVNLLAMQAVVALGGMQTPTGEQIQPHPEMARIYIDMLDMLEQKTKGNLTPEEARVLTSALHELRAGYVQMMGGGMAPQPK